MKRSLWMRMHRFYLDEQGRIFRRTNAQTIEIIPSYIVSVVALFDVLCLCAGLVITATWIIK